MVLRGLIDYLQWTIDVSCTLHLVRHNLTYLHPRYPEKLKSAVIAQFSAVVSRNTTKVNCSNCYILPCTTAPCRVMELESDWLLAENLSEIAVGNQSSLLPRPVGELAVGALTFLVIIFMTVSGNILVILSVFTHRPLKKVQNYFLVSLAAADLAVATLVMPFHVVKFLIGKWMFGLFACQIWLTFDILCCTASILNLCAIALDRYWAIHSPIEYANKRTLKLVLTMLTVVWVLSGLISIPPLIGWNDWAAKDLSTTCELTTKKGFVIFSATLSFYAPLGVMTIVYCKIFIAARQRLRQNRAKSGVARLNTARAQQDPPPPVLRQSDTPEDDQHVTLLTTVNTGNDKLPVKGEQKRHSSQLENGEVSSGEQGQKEGRNPSIKFSRAQSFRDRPRAAVRSFFRKKEKISVSKEKKAAKTLAIIMGVFVLCWLPFFLMYVILPFCESCYLHPKVNEAITWLGYINSAINPVIYTIFNLDFRRAFQKFICPKSSR